MAWANRVNTVSKQRVALFFCVRRILPALFFFGKGACGHSLFGRCLTITELMINEQIRDKEIRLIDENGEQLGIVSSREAQKIADERKLDLVKIAPTAKPPVCRIMDYGKYKFDQAKKEKEARKKQKVVEIKEIRLSPNIDSNDLNTKMNAAKKFLSKGDKVKITVAPKGFGSENMSRIKMLPPSAGEDGVKDFVVDTCLQAGANPCPPIVIGVGIGGTFDKAALLAKKALLSPAQEPNSDPYYAQMEAELLERINQLGIGPQGFGGKTTALAVSIRMSCSLR